MIVAAGLLVFAGLGLFVAGVLTGVTVFYWACVGACVVAAVLLFLVRRQLRTTALAAPSAARPPSAPRSGTGRHAGADDASPTAVPAAAPAGNRAAPHEEPPVEEVEVTDLLLVVGLRDEVLVVDERPRYHVAGCRHLAGQDTVPLPVDEAKTDGFTPCGTCRPDATLAARVRAQGPPGS